MSQGSSEHGVWTICSHFKGENTASKSSRFLCRFASRVVEAYDTMILFRCLWDRAKKGNANTDQDSKEECWDRAQWESALPRMCEDLGSIPSKRETER